jgi:hypothetical protein
MSEGAPAAVVSLRPPSHYHAAEQLWDELEAKFTLNRVRGTLSALLLLGRAPTPSTGCATTSDTTCSAVVALLGRNHRRARLPGTGAHRISWGPTVSSSRTFPSRDAPRSRGHFSWFFAVPSTSGLGPPHHPCRAGPPPIAASRRSPGTRDQGSSLDGSGDFGNRT